MAKVNIAIVGGGTAIVELSAGPQRGQQLHSYGYKD